MVSDGDAEGYRRNRIALGGLAGAVIAMISVGLISLALSWGSHTRAIRERSHPIPATKCHQDHSCEEKALEIDAREAITADVALDVAFVQLSLSFAGLIAVGATLYYAHRAWREAQKGAHASEKAVEIASDTAKRQLRAYVIISGARIENIGNSRRRTLVISANNYGQTPATDVQVWRQVVFRPFPFAEDFDHAYPDSLHPHRDIIGPGQTQSTHMRIPGRLSRTGIRGLVRKRSAYYVFGRIQYRDIFGDEHVTDFRFSSTGSRKGAMQADDRGNEMT